MTINRKLYKSSIYQEHMAKRTKKIIITLLIVVPLILLASLAYSIFILKPEIKNDSWNGAVNNGNVCDFLSGTNLVEGLNRNSVILFETYDFSTGTKNVITSCVVKKGYAKETLVGNYDMKVSLHEKHVPNLGNDFCSAIQDARKTKDIGFELDESLTKVFLRYLKVLKYGDCSGFI